MPPPATDRRTWQTSSHFPADPPPEKPPSYLVHRFAQSGGVLTSRNITARDDTDAKRKAIRLSAGHRAELWASNRLVAEFGSFRTR